MKIDRNEGQKAEASYPIYDLPEAVKIAEAVRDLGGGNSPVAKSLLAQHLKYAESGPSFFQRVAGSKAFGLIDGRGSYALTELAKQYFYPTIENGKQIAAVKALTFPKAFSILVQKFDGGKLPTIEMIGNIIHTEADIPVSKKSILAGCFMRSAQFVGVIDTGGFLRCKAFVAAGNRATSPNGHSPTTSTPPTPAAEKQSDQKETDDDDNESQTQTLYLDNKRKRKITIKAPFTVTKTELERIRAWLGFQLIVEEKNLASSDEAKTPE